MATPHPGSWKTVLSENNCVLNTQQVAAHAFLIYTPGLDVQFPWKVLYFYAGGREDPNGDNKVRTRIWDPNSPSNPISYQNIPDWPPVEETDMPRILCSGHIQMANGEIIVAGGVRLLGDVPMNEIPHPPDNCGIAGLNYTYIFNPNTGVWRVAGEELGNAHAMGDDRFYPTLTQLGVTPQGFSGKLVVMSGWTIDPDLAREPQFYDEANGWSYFPFTGATQPFDGHFDYYPTAHLAPYGPLAGKIFYSIPMLQSYIFNPYWNGIPNGGYWQGVGSARSIYRLNGTSTMLPLLPPYTSAKVIIMGGSEDYPDAANKSAEVIDIAETSPQWTSLGDLLYFARKNHLSVILPNDMLFVVGGNIYNYSDDPEYTAELVDTTNSSPTKWKSTMLPAHVYPRGHHLTAVLLPDGSVWVSGQGGVSLPEQYNIEIYEPGYLFDAVDGARPSINSVPDEITYGTPFNIETSHQISAIRLIRFAAVTHSTDMSQLSVGLSFEALPPNGVNPYSVTPPPDANVAPPGFYMLFVLRDKSHSISGESALPSIAKIVKLT